MSTDSASIFTDHIRALCPGRPLSDDHLGQVWKKLRLALVRELRRRGLWQIPPSYLGVHGAGTWTREAVEELLLDCYSAAFLDRLRSLQAQLEVRSNIDGVIYRNVRNFVHDTQRRHDPLGFRVYNLLRLAVLAALDAGELSLLEGDAAVRNGTVLAFTQNADLASAQNADLASAQSADLRVAAVDDLEDLVPAWNDDLLPDLVTALGRAQARVVSHLGAKLSALSAEGIEAFRFQDVCNPLKRDARNRWRTVSRHQEGELVAEEPDRETAILVRQVLPTTDVEDRDSFQKLLTCVGAGIDALHRGAVDDNHLRRLWIFLRTYAADLATPDSTGIGANDAPPSRRKMARLLAIPRNRVGPLIEQLRALIEGCRSRFTNPSVIASLESTGPSPPHGEPTS